MVYLNTVVPLLRLVPPRSVLLVVAHDHLAIVLIAAVLNRVVLALREALVVAERLWRRRWRRRRRRMRLHAAGVPIHVLAMEVELARNYITVLERAAAMRLAVLKEALAGALRLDRATRHAVELLRAPVGVLVAPLVATLDTAVVRVAELLDAPLLPEALAVAAGVVLRGRSGVQDGQEGKENKGELHDVLIV